MHWPGLSTAYFSCSVGWLAVLFFFVGCTFGAIKGLRRHYIEMLQFAMATCC